MRALLIFLVTIAAAGLLGVVFYRLEKRLKRNWSRTVVGLIGAFISLIGASIYLFDRSDSVPASDNAMFSQSETFVVAIIDRALLEDPMAAVQMGADHVEREPGDAKDTSTPKRNRWGESSSMDPTSREPFSSEWQQNRARELLVERRFPPKAWFMTIELTLPVSARVEDEVPVKVTVNSSMTLSNADGTSTDTVVIAGKEIDVSPRPQCEATSQIQDEASRKYCVRTDLGVPGIIFLRAEKPGKAFITLQLPPALKMRLSEHPDWLSIASFEGEVVSTSGFRCRGANCSGAPTGEPLLVFSPKSPVFSDERMELDYRRFDVTLPLEWQTTLGVSSATFALLSKVGLALSSLLGTGWLWHLLDVGKRRSRGSDEREEEGNDAEEGEG